MKDDSSLEISDINKRALETVHMHQRRLRLLTGAAFLLGFLAIAASIGIASAYFVLYRPKQMQLLRDVTAAAQEARSNNAAPSPGQPPRRQLDFPSVQATMTHVLSFATMMVAVSVGLLGAGTLVLLVLVVLSRRATLQQINASLTQISALLRELRPEK
jgi:hypothetical protein